MEKSDHYDLALLEALVAKGSFRYWPETTSTNDRAAEWIRDLPPQTPALLLAESQTAGRGQQQRVWFSSPGNLMASWIFKAATAGPVGDWTARLALAAPLAACHAIGQVCGPGTPCPMIKWPNDVFLGPQKTGGILIETFPAAGQLFGVVGIGINVNAGFPPPGKDPHRLNELATSLLQASGSPVDLTRLLKALHEALVFFLQPMVPRAAETDLPQPSGELPPPSRLVDEYRMRMMYRDQAITVATPSGPIRGLCRGISDSGALLIQSAEGWAEVSSGRITEVAPQPNSGL